MLTNLTKLFTKENSNQEQRKESKGCFPSMAKVKVETGKLVTMSELQIGDRVQTGMLSNFSLMVN